jgi:plastocyanin
MRRAVVPLAMVAFLLAFTACSGGSDGAGAPKDVPGSPEATTTVDLPKSYRFEPAVITVEVGETVTWTNSDDFPHNVHLLDGSERTLDLPIGGSARFTFLEPGEIAYQCSLHPQQMQGTVTVA